jgi:hypothetical protein
LSYRYRPEAPININENLPVGTKLAKFMATDRDIGDTVHYEFIGTQKEFAINEGIIIFIVSHLKIYYKVFLFIKLSSKVIMLE